MLAFKFRTFLYIAGFSILVAGFVHAFPLAARGRFGTDWILESFDKGPFTPDEKKVFEPILTDTGLKLGGRLSVRGNNNIGIFSASAPYAAKDLLVKAVPDSSSGEFLGEVKALKLKPICRVRFIEGSQNSRRQSQTCYRDDQATWGDHFR
ncbi:hypothetical protein GYMLUDRAFT_933099 [Collybiopsis luxurians FD-317 M1]|nr:hypothetical protein GYMLUDRAFT_933099 [Collybiopsis luxurians FD-317 M1]